MATPAWVAELGLGRPARWPAMGVHVDEAAWPDPGTADPERLALRRRLAAEHPDCLGVLPEGRALVDEVVELAAAALGPAVAAGDLAAVAVAQGDDLCLLAPDGAWTLVAGAVLFPSHWRLADKLGRPLAEVHGPVPGYPDARVDRFLDRLRPGQAVWRRNLLVHRDGELHAPEPRTDDVPPERWWLRSERQTLRLLPRTGGVLFTIRTDTTPLASLDPATRRALADRLEALPPAWAPYAGVGAHLPGLVRSLRS